jgi:hypothetical protein
MGVVGGIAAAAGGLASLGSSIAGASNQPTIAGAGGGSPFLYQPTGQPSQDVNYQTLLNQMFATGQGLPQQLLPQYQQYAANIQNNPFAASALQGAQTYGGLAQQGAGALQGAGNAILGQAFDPQQALYNQLQQQMTDQLNAANAASGVSGPYAAGTTAQGLTNFNIDWQNQQLQRMLSGEQGAGQAYTGALSLGQGGSQLPYQTYLGQQQAGLGGLQALTTGAQQAFGLPQMTLSDIQSYLGLGQAAGANALAGQQQAFGQNQILGQNLSSALTNPYLAGLFGNTGISPAAVSAVGNYNSLYGTSYDTSANDNYGYSGFDFSQAG